jgi:MFS family permease
MKARTAYISLLVVIYFAFISLGLPDAGFGIAWPFMRLDFAKPLEAAGLVTISITVFSALSSIFSGHVLLRFGTGKVTLVSGLMTATALIGYGLAPSFLWILACVPLLGFGGGAIDCGLNFYVAKNYSGRHMNWLHCAWGVGATVGPIILTAFVARSGAWRTGYFTIGAVQFALALILFLSIGLWGRVEADVARAAEKAAGESGGNAAANADGIDDRGEASVRGDDAAMALEGGKDPKKAMITQILVFACYTSGEYIAGLWAFSLLTQARGLDAGTAGVWVSLYYGALTAGRFLNGIIVDRFGNRRMIRTGLFVAVLGTAFLALKAFVPGSSDLAALAGLLLMGLGFAPLYPCMMHETPRRFRNDVAQKLIGYQSGAAYVGGALTPALVGLVAAHSTLEIIPFIELALVAALIALTVSLDRLTRARTA